MKVKELYSDPNRWAQGTEAKNEKGEPTYIFAEEAVAWCLAGAIDKCYYPNQKGRSLVYQKIATRDLGRAIVSWNDDPKRTFEEVKALVEELDI